MARIQLAHFVEGVGERYLCVEGYIQSYEENIIIFNAKDTAKNGNLTIYDNDDQIKWNDQSNPQEDNKLRKKNKKYAIG